MAKTILRLCLKTVSDQLAKRVADLLSANTARVAV